MGSIKISCLGDLLPADTAYTLGNGIGSKMTNLIDYYSKNDNNPFLKSDMVFCNLEASLIQEHKGHKLPFEGNPEVVRLMHLLNISIVSVANNHIPDHGREAFEHTTQELDNNGIGYVGSIQDSVSRVCLIEKNGKKIAFSAFNDIQDHHGNLYIAPIERDILFNTLDSIKKESPDYIIFSFHWGNEYITYPSPEQVNLAHELIDNGVNIIIGHHPHVVQPVETYHGGVIIYSLGNFLFDMFWSEPVRNGMQVDLVVNDDKSIGYQIKPFRLRSDFTPDYTRTKRVFSILAKSEKKMKLLQAGPHEVYEKGYRLECKKKRSGARFKMKLYLLLNACSLSSQSRKYLFRNIIMKSRLLWKNN